MDGRLQVLGQIGAEMAQALDREALLNLAVTVARELTGATYSSLGFVQEEWIFWQAGTGKPLEEIKGVRQALGEGLCGWVVRNGRSRRSDDVRREGDYYEQYPEMRSELDVPIKTGDQVIGVLNVESPEVAAFDEQDQLLLEVLAGYVAIAVSHGV
ncbi:MAG: GAF domain-containing protein [bacterium]